MVVDAKILLSEWVIPNEDDWGYRLKEGAPADVAAEFELYQATVNRNLD
jgi:hypothetical protein